MPKFLVIFSLVIFSIFCVFLLKNFRNTEGTGAPPYEIDDLEPPVEDPYDWISDWKRSEGPPRVGLQVGHWKNDELPEELARLRGNTGSSGGGKSEWEVNYQIAILTKEILEKEGVVVDILPSTVPPKYSADAFIAIHADGSENPETSGFKIASPRRDFTQKAKLLVQLLESNYKTTSGMKVDPNISRNMTGYYAFAWWRHEHAVHPMTPSAILETGFLTSPADRKIIVTRPNISAQGLANGILAFLTEQKLLPKLSQP